MTLRIGISARLLHASPPELGLPQKPLQFLESSMAQWIMGRHAIALMVPFADAGSPMLQDQAPLEDLVGLLDGLVLQGGIDVSPALYGATPLKPDWQCDPIRDAYEMALLGAFVDAGKPVLGICRGAQLINVFFGGTLVQDIPSQRPQAQVHRDTGRYDRLMHDVEFLPGSTLAALYPGLACARVTSIHHQCVDRLGAGLRVEARNPHDGLIEAIRRQGPGFVMGVQWHPEFHLTPLEADGCLLDSGPVMQVFLDAARARAARHQAGAPLGPA